MAPPHRGGFRLPCQTEILLATPGAGAAASRRSSPQRFERATVCCRRPLGARPPSQACAPAGRPAGPFSSAAPTELTSGQATMELWSLARGAAFDRPAIHLTGLPHVSIRLRPVVCQFSWCWWLQCGPRGKPFCALSIVLRFEEPAPVRNIRTSHSLL